MQKSMIIPRNKRKDIGAHRSDFVFSIIRKPIHLQMICNPIFQFQLFIIRKISVRIYLQNALKEFSLILRKTKFH